MNVVETVKTFVTALQSGDMTVAVEIMSDDFRFESWTPQPLDKGQFLAMQSALLYAMPDFSYQLSDVNEPDNNREREARARVAGLIHITGTHTNDLNLPMLGIPFIAATGLLIDLPQVTATYLFKDDKIVEVDIQVVPGGGLSGLLQQVGGELPIAPRLENKQDL